MHVFVGFGTYVFVGCDIYVFFGYMRGPGPARPVYVCDLARTRVMARVLPPFPFVPQTGVSGARGGHVVSPLSELIQEQNKKITAKQNFTLPGLIHW